MKKLKTILQSNTFYIVFFLFLLIYIFLVTKIFSYNTKFLNDTNEITAKVISYNIDGDKLSLHLKEREKFVATYYIGSAKEKEYLIENLKIGSKVYLNGSENTLTNNTIPNTFNYKKYLYNQKIYFSFSVSDIKILSSKYTFFDLLKNKVNERIEKLDNDKYLKAFILGDKSLFESELNNIIKNNGVSHLFALSGMHLSFVYIFLNKLLKKVKHKRIIIYLILLCYLVLSSFSISFLRAILFTFLLDLNKQYKLEISNIKILYLTAILILLYNPFYIYNIGFIYTFAVTFSLLFSASFINQNNSFLKILKVSTITFLFSMPITIYLNYKINILSILNNIILVPFVSFIVFPLALVAFFIPLILPIFQMCTLILEKINILFDTYSIMLIVGKINILEIIIYYLILLLLIKAPRKIFILIYIMYFWLLYNKNLFDSNYYVYYLDVGQGDSTLLVSPYKKEAILIDTGGKITYSKEEWQERKKEFNLSDNIVLFLKSIRIRKIDLFIATHGDADHIGYASNIIDKIKIKNVLINKGDITALEDNIIKKVKPISIYESKYFNYQLLNNNLYNNENDNSIVSLFKIYNYTFLFMGDASINVEKYLLEKYTFNNIDFLKVGHHGSNTSTSSDFINTIKPKYSIISVGKNNRYGHPKKEVLDILKRTNIYRTDLNGTIEVKINKSSYKIKTYN